jgi:hypothetical protein
VRHLFIQHLKPQAILQSLLPAKMEILGYILAIVFGIFWVYKAFTATQFENIGEHNPPEEDRFVPATLPMRIGVGILAFGLAASGGYCLIKWFLAHRH